MLSVRDSQKRLTYECTWLCASYIIVCTSVRSFICACSEVPGSMFACHARVLDSTPIEVTFFKLIV